jgi:hypothetical protein
MANDLNDPQIANDPNDPQKANDPNDPQKTNDLQKQKCFIFVNCYMCRMLSNSICVILICAFQKYLSPSPVVHLPVVHLPLKNLIKLSQTLQLNMLFA